MANKRFLTYENIQAMLNEVFREMAKDNFKPDYVVGLVRGGLIPAVHVSQYFDVPLIAYKYALRDHAGKDDTQKLFNLVHTGKKILVVDDLCDEGHTLHDVMKIFRSAYAEEAVYNERVRTAVLQHNVGAKLFEPNYYGEEINKVEKPEWIVYPWEY